MDESTHILNSFESQPDSWRNVANSVVDAIKSAMRTNVHTSATIDSLKRRLDAVENKLLDVTAIVDVFKHNFARIDSRIEGMHEQVNRGIKGVAAQSQAFREQFDEDNFKSNAEHQSLVAKLVNHIRSLETKLSANIDVQDEVMHLTKDKVDVHTFNRTIDNLRVRLEQLTMPQPFLYTAGGEAAISSVGRPGAGSGSSRWLWDGGSFTSMGRAIPWSKQIATSGRDVEWHPQSPHTIKIVRGGIYRISIGIFHDAADTSVPSVGVYIDNDAVINATNCSTYMLKQTRRGKARAARTACGCLPQCVNGLTVTDSFFIPPDAIVAVAYRADPRNVVQAFLEIEPFV